MYIIEPRASTVLYNFLINNCKGFTFYLPANVCPVVPLVFLKANVDFNFVDINMKTFTGLFNTIIDKLRDTSKKHGILYVNSYGNKNDNTELYNLIKSIDESNIIIEDNCLCFPEIERLKPSDNIDLELYSTGISKCIGISIGGGYGLIAEHLLYKKSIGIYNEADETQQVLNIRKAKNEKKQLIYKDNNWLVFEKKKFIKYSDEQYFFDIKSKIPEILSHKKRINEIYKRIIPKEIQMKDNFNMWRFNIRVPSKFIQQEIIASLVKEGLYASCHYGSVAYIFNKQTCNIAEKLGNEVINLFNEPKYTEEMAEKTASIIKNIIEKRLPYNTKLNN